MTLAANAAASNVSAHPAALIVRELRRVNKGSLLAFLDLEIPAWHMTIYDCKWFRTPTAEWIGFPSSSFTTREGTTRYKTLIEFSDKDVARRFGDRALAAVRAFSEKAR